MANYTDTYKESDIVFSDGATAHVSSTYTDWRSPVGEEQTLWRSYTRYLSDPSSVVDLRSYLPSSTISSGVFDAIFNQWVDYEYFSGDEYGTAVEIFEDKSSYLWGSFDGGGAFFIKTAADTYDMWLHNGLFYNDSTDKYKIDAGYLGTYSGSQLSKVMFFWDAWSESEATSWSGAVYLVMHVNSAENSIALYLPSELNPGYNRVYTNVDNTLLGAIEPTWIGITEYDFKAEAIWRGGTYRNFFGPSDLDNYSRVGGSANPEEFDWEFEPYADDGFSSGGGGGGNIDHKSDEDGTSDSTNIGTLLAQSGLVKVYNPSSAELSSFNQFLFSGLSTSIVDTLKKLTSEPMQYIISLGLYHFTPSTGASEHIKFGGVDSGVGSAVVSSLTKKIDCGSVKVPAQFQSFLDYNPYSTVQLFLPYCGFVDLAIDEIIGSSVKVVYNVDLLSGACIAEVHISRSARSSSDDTIRRILYTYSGNCLMQVPVSSVDQRGLVQSIFSFVGSAAGGAATGGAAGAVAGAVGGLGDLITSEKIATHRGSGIGANVGYLGKQKPYFVLGRPITCIPPKFGSFEGWTSNLYRKVSSLSGYTEIDPNTIWTDGFAHATDEEAQMIKDIMNGGVYL